MNIDQQEVQKFSELAEKWWDKSGDFKPLHIINPLRAGYIASKVDLVGKKVLDVGCGGGILAEALSDAGAIVTGIAEFGLFAEIQGFYISGLIHVTELPSDRYFLDKDSNILKGKKTGRSYRLGQNILVTIANVSAEERKITLVPKYKKNK